MFVPKRRRVSVMYTTKSAFSNAKLIKLMATSLFFANTASAQSHPVHPSCSIDLLSESDAFQQQTQQYLWSKQELITIYTQADQRFNGVNCDYYNSADTITGGVRNEKFRERYTFFQSNFNRTSYTTSATGNTHRSIIGVLWNLDDNNQYAELSDFWYHPAIETDAGYIFDLGGGELACCYTNYNPPLRAFGQGPECVDDNNGDDWGWTGTRSCLLPVDLVATNSNDQNSETNNGCDYSSAALHDGWGWNQTTGQSCEPLDSYQTTAECNYDLASSFNGWGWNEATQESCPPTNQSLQTLPAGDAACDYRQANREGGWGWNPVTLTSCPPR